MDFYRGEARETASRQRRSRVEDDRRLAEALLGFHAGHRPEAPDGDAYSVCMHREDARTVSRTLVVVGPREAVMRYHAGWPCQPAEEHRENLPRSS